MYRMRQTVVTGGIFLYLFVFQGVTPAGVAPVTLDLTAPTPTENTLDITLTVTYLGVSQRDTQSTVMSGDVLSDLTVFFDGNTQTLRAITGLAFTGGRVAFSDVSFSLNYGLLGSLNADATDIGGTLTTPLPPGEVNGGEFDGLDHEFLINEGVVEASGTGLVQVGLGGDITVDLSAEAIIASLPGTGTVAMSLSFLTTEIAVYDVVLTVPVNFDEVIYEDTDNAIEARLSAVGTLSASGQFSRKPCPLAADLTGDCAVALEDLALIVDDWLRVAGEDDFLSADIAAGDGEVNLLEMAVVSSEWLQENYTASD